MNDVTVPVTRADRELYWKLITGSLQEKDGTEACYQLIAHHAEQARLSERERCAKICEDIAEAWDLRRMGAPNATNAELCAEIAISHRLNASGIRKGNP